MRVEGALGEVGFAVELAGAAVPAEACAEAKMVETQKSARQLTMSRAGNPAVLRAIFMRIPSLEQRLQII